VDITAIAATRKRLGLSYRRLARAAGCSGAHLWDCEHGRRQLSQALLDRLSHELNLCEARRGGEAADPARTGLEARS
jgi:transcriptional regulator with XRE-family HTH domain